MTPAARIAAAIDLLDAVDASPAPPPTPWRTNSSAPAASSAAVTGARFSDRAWGNFAQPAAADLGGSIVRVRRRRRGCLVAASLLLEGWSLDGVSQSFSGGQFAPAPLLAPERAALRTLESRTLEHPDMPPAVRLEVPDWIFPRLEARFGDAVEAELAALGTPAPLDLRVKLLKTTREQALAALAAEGIDAVPTRYSPWGLRMPGRRALTTGPAFSGRAGGNPGRGLALVAVLVGGGRLACGWRIGAPAAGGKTLAWRPRWKTAGTSWPAMCMTNAWPRACSGCVGPGCTTWNAT
ncbi:MAG: hypothetical protein WDN04_07320 [Rhodospirillales bacterium]